MDEQLKKERIKSLLKKGMLVSPDFLEESGGSDFQETEGIVVLDRQASELISGETAGVNWKELEKVKVMYEQGRAKLPEVEVSSPVVNRLDDVEVIISHKVQTEKINVSHFVRYFNTRYKLLASVLAGRPEMANLTSAKRLTDRAVINNISVIGMVSEKQETKNKNIMLTIEDSTGKVRVIVNRNRNDMFSEAKDIVLDEVIGIGGSFKNGLMFANSITFPDTPSLEIKKSPQEEYMACMSDLHFGSKQFMPDEFNKFLSWVNLEAGNDRQKAVAEKLKYILIAGDIVDGIGIYNNQFSELTIPDVKKQYDECAKFLSQIPEHINVVISPGNHDAVRMAEPQPPLGTHFSESLSKLKNVILVSNPGVVRIGRQEGFSGFNCLMYHGYSFDDYVANVDSIRQNGGYERGDLIMKFLLRRRHLAPMHTSTLIQPTPDSDALFINPVPDFFVTGHIHRTSISQYKATTLINSSCWQSMTSFQERLGHNPQPARLPVVNLKTRDASIINFGK